VVACGFLYLQHDMAARQAELFRLYREEQSIRHPGASPAPEPDGAIEITSHPEGCAIWLNGDLQPDVTPTKLVKVPIGREAHIKLSKEGFVPYRTILKLTEDAPFKEIDATLKGIPFTVVLRTDPFATVWVDGKMWSGDRSKIDGLSASDEHRLVIAANGYVTKAIHVTAKAGETRAFDAHLRKAEPPPAALVSDGGHGIVALPY
jgi:serine/threonine-protein kinase